MLPTQKHISQPKISRMIKLRWDTKDDGGRGREGRKRERRKGERL